MKLAIAVLVLASSSTALADKGSKADELFKRAKKLLAEHKYAEACPKFEESYQLDPGIGGELNLGRCYEEWGKLARAYHAYVEAERQAKSANDPRAAKIHELVTNIEPQVPRLQIHVPAGADTTGLSVSVDGQPVPTSELDTAQLVDPGPKQVDYTAAGVKKQKLVPVERGSTAEVTLDVPAAAKPEPVDKPDTGEKPAPKPVAETDVPGRTQRIAGIAVGAAGIVGVGVASYLALSARSDYNSALSADCMNMKNACNAAGLTATHDARSRANVATIVGGIGLAAIAGGVVLYLLAPDSDSNEHAFYVTPTTNGLAFGGRY
jgi:tetratricopeptide (TPR) repeat protein